MMSERGKVMMHMPAHKDVAHPAGQVVVKAIRLSAWDRFIAATVRYFGRPI